MARILDASDIETLKLAAEIIRQGGLVAFPTETVYGLGADACNPLAVARVFECKGRPRIDPLIVHVADPEEAARYGRLTESGAARLTARFWPGPLTLVVTKHAIVPSIVTAGLDTVALRMPAHPVALGLLRCSKRAIAAPSANLFSRVSPTEAQHVEAQLGVNVDLILDGGKCSVGVESTILSLSGPRPRILRAGGIPAEEIESVIGPVEKPLSEPSGIEAPGQFKSHYATLTPLVLLSGAGAALAAGSGERVGLLSFTPPPHPERYAAVEVLSPSGDLREAAANLFAALHRLDRLGLDRLEAHPVPEFGLGAAIMDRLRRCSSQ